MLFAGIFAVSSSGKSYTFLQVGLKQMIEAATIVHACFDVQILFLV